MSVGARAVPFYCPFCGEQDIRPDDGADHAGQDHAGGPPGAGWRCESCERRFALTLIAIGGED